MRCRVAAQAAHVEVWQLGRLVRGTPTSPTRSPLCTSQDTFLSTSWFWKVMAICSTVPVRYSARHGHSSALLCTSGGGTLHVGA